MTDVDLTGVHRWRRFLIQLLAQKPEPEPQSADVDLAGVYGSANREPGESTTALGRYREPQPVVAPEPPRRPDISLDQATRRIPLLERTLANLGMSEQEAVIYDRLATSWRGLPGDEGPATDHTTDAVRLPALDQEGGDSRE